MLDTKQMQEKLKTLGFYKGAVDGIAGPQTSAAIIAFKKSVGLQPNDNYGPITDAELQKQQVVVKVVAAQEPAWLTQARALNGLREIKGPKHEAKILEMWKTLGLPYQDDETSWCAAFVGYCLEKGGVKSTRSAGARSYENWGVKLSKPVPGCVVTFWRGDPKGWSGHVGFVVGQDKAGRPLVLGGNQADAVNIKAFDTDRVTGYWWPKEVPVTTNPLQTFANGAEVSTNEA